MVEEFLGRYDNQEYSHTDKNLENLSMPYRENNFSINNKNKSNKNMAIVTFRIIIILLAIFIIIPIVTLVKLDKLIRDNNDIKLDNNTYNVIRWNSILWIITLILLIIVCILIIFDLSTNSIYKKKLEPIKWMILAVLCILLIILLIYSLIAIPVFIKFANWYKTVPNKNANTYNLVLAQVIIQLITLLLICVTAVFTYINKHSRE